MKISEEDFFNLVCTRGFYSKPERLRFFVQSIIRRCNLSGKRILDIEAGMVYLDIMLC